MENKNLIVRSGNPGLNDRTFAGLPRPALASDRMSLQGTINKSFVMLVVLMAAAFYPWSQYLQGGDASAVGLPAMIGMIGGLVLALIISFKPPMAQYLALPYAACEGLLLGAISAILERRYPGVAIQAVGLTFAVLAGLLIAYTTRLIRVTQRMRSMVVAGTLGLGLLYLASWVLNMFHIQTPFMYGSGALSIGISLLAIGLAAFNLVLDFDLIENGVQQGAPRYMEWYGAFGLLVTLVWLYVELLRLLSNVRQR